MAEQIPHYQIPTLFTRVIGNKVYSYSAFGTLISVTEVSKVKEIKEVDPQDPNFVKLPQANTYFIQTEPTGKRNNRWNLVADIKREVGSALTVLLGCGHTIRNSIFMFKVEGIKGVYPLQLEVGNGLICCPFCKP